MSNRAFCALLAALILLLSGCADKQEAKPIRPMLFYYRSALSEGDLVAAEQVDLGMEEVPLSKILALYAAGPRSDSLSAPFPAGTQLETVSQEDGCLTLRLSEQAEALHGIDRSLLHACLTMTLTQLAQIDSVKIVSDENAVSSSEHSPLTPEEFLLTDGLASIPEQAAYLYFIDGNGDLDTERRSIAFSEGEDVARKTVEALLAGPEQPGHFSALPEGVQIIDIDVENGLCRLIVSEQFIDCDVSPTRASQAVRCTVATLCSLNMVNSVQIVLVDGSTLTYYDISQPITPESSWY